MVYEIYLPKNCYLEGSHLYHHSADAGISGIKLKLLPSTTDLCESFFRVMKVLNMNVKKKSFAL